MNKNVANLDNGILIASKKKEIMVHAITGMNLENMLSEERHS